MNQSVISAHQHVCELNDTLGWLRQHVESLANWGTDLARELVNGSRLLAAGNGGSAAEAQHLTAELVGKFSYDRKPFSAIALHADTSSMTAIGNDYGYDEVFARQVQAHARPGDILVLLSTSGQSKNLLRAVESARELQVVSWALTGPAPNPLADIVDRTLCVPGTSTTVQETHLIAIHLLCAAFDHALSQHGIDGNRRVS